MPASNANARRRKATRRRGAQDLARRVVVGSYAAFAMLAIGFAGIAQHSFAGRAHATARRLVHPTATPLVAPAFVGAARRQVVAERKARGAAARAAAPPSAPPPPPAPTADAQIPPGDNAGPTAPS